MFYLIVNDPVGAQLLLEIDKTGQYFDQSRVIWDSRIDGKIPKDIELGKMIRDNKSLKKLDDFIPEHKNFLDRKNQEEQEERNRKEKEDGIKDSINNDELLTELKDLNASEIDQWFADNSKNKSSDVLKLAIKLLIKNGLLK